MGKKLYGTVLLKAKKILDYLATEKNAPTLKEISDYTLINKPTALKILQTLEYCGFIKTAGNPKQYYLGFVFLQYAQKVKESFNLDKVAMPFLNKLRDQTTEAVNLGIKQGNKIVLLDRAQSNHNIRFDLKIGGQMSMYCSGMGKAILSLLSSKQIERYLDETALVKKAENTITNHNQLLKEIAKTKERGYAIDNIENQEGIYCLGFAITKGSNILGAFSISAPIFRINDTKKKLWIHQGLATQKLIEAAI